MTAAVVQSLELLAVKVGSQNQLERWMAGVLPEHELLELARGDLFAAFGTEFKRWKNVSDVVADGDIHSNRECSDPDSDLRVIYATVDAASLRHAQWEVMKKLQDRVDLTVKTHNACIDYGCTITLHPRSHVAECAWCHRTVTYTTALVKVEWAGRTLTREYQL